MNTDGKMSDQEVKVIVEDVEHQDEGADANDKKDDCIVAPKIIIEEIGDEDEGVDALCGELFSSTPAERSLAPSPSTTDELSFTPSLSTHAEPSPDPSVFTLSEPSLALSPSTSAERSLTPSPSTSKDEFVLEIEDVVADVVNAGLDETSAENKVNPDDVNEETRKVAPLISNDELAKAFSKLRKRPFDLVGQAKRAELAASLNFRPISRSRAPTGDSGISLTSKLSGLTTPVNVCPSLDTSMDKESSVQCWVNDNLPEQQIPTPPISDDPEPNESRARYFSELFPILGKNFDGKEWLKRCPTFDPTKPTPGQNMKDFNDRLEYDNHVDKEWARVLKLYETTASGKLANPEFRREEELSHKHEREHKLMYADFVDLDLKQALARTWPKSDLNQPMDLMEWMVRVKTANDILGDLNLNLYRDDVPESGPERRRLDTVDLRKAIYRYNQIPKEKDGSVSDESIKRAFSPHYPEFYR